MPRLPDTAPSSSSAHIDASETEAYDLPTDAEIDAELRRLEGSSGSRTDGDLEAQQPFMGLPSAGGGSGASMGMNSMATASQYRLQRGERLKGVANRIIFSRYYVLFYGVMMVLSLATVVLSLMARGESFDDSYTMIGWLTNDRWLSVRGLAYFRGGDQCVDGVGSGNAMGGIWQGTSFCSPGQTTYRTSPLSDSLNLDEGD